MTRYEKSKNSNLMDDRRDAMTSLTDNKIEIMMSLTDD
jgi:hypothetical protein